MENNVLFLTATKADINKVKSLIDENQAQENKADKIALYLSKTDFPSTRNLPRNLSEYRKSGLLIIYLVDNPEAVIKESLGVADQEPQKVSEVPMSATVASTAKPEGEVAHRPNHRPKFLNQRKEMMEKIRHGNPLISPEINKLRAAMGLNKVSPMFAR